ncbi:putative pyroglutamyl peptidase type I [Amanita rubescens]|nr:putative pyroglutamyl peptidase type I [Amanita rubescens]KAF8345658.1 putative pyroglutamyl peptidase type I [Amanita rubescens]
MGDQGPTIDTSSPSAVSDEILVLVTGYGPFDTNPVNASFLIASSLPSTITFPPAANPTPATAPSRNISVHVHPSPIPVSYSVVRETVPAIIKDFTHSHAGRYPDIIIHMGIASYREYYSVETQAHRDLYLLADIDGRSGENDGEKLWREKEFPELLRPGPTPSAAIPVSTIATSRKMVAYPPNDHFLSTWESFIPPNTDVRISDDAGRYLCEFIFYTTMSQLWLEGRDRNVVFFHVPDSCEDGDVKLGMEAAIALIKTLVTCWVDEAKM